MAKKRRKLTPKEAKTLIPFMQEFNSVANEFLKMLNFRVEEKEKRIRLMVTDMAIPMQPSFNINVQTVDMRNTKVYKRGSISSNKTFDWEKEFRQNKGFII